MRVSTTTGFLKWKTVDSTDLDYTPLPLVTRDNAEESFQFTQEVRVANAVNAPIELSDSADLKWQGGVFFFTQNYEQNATRNFSDGSRCLSLPEIAPPASDSPEAS